MSRSTNIVAFLPPDEEWLKMKAAYDACVAADVEIPHEVEEIVGEDPTEHGREIRLNPTEWEDDYREGWDVDLSKLPAGTKVIRFYHIY